MCTWMPSEVLMETSVGGILLGRCVLCKLCRFTFFFFYLYKFFQRLSVCQVHSLSSHTLLAIPSIEIVKDPILGPFWTPVEQPCTINYPKNCQMTANLVPCAVQVSVTQTLKKQVTKRSLPSRDQTSPTCSHHAQVRMVPNHLTPTGGLFCNNTAGVLLRLAERHTFVSWLLA